MESATYELQQQHLENSNSDVSEVLQSSIKEKLTVGEFWWKMTRDEKNSYDHDDDGGEASRKAFKLRIQFCYWSWKAFIIIIIDASAVSPSVAI